MEICEYLKLKIKSFVIFAVLRRSVQRVCGAHFHVIAIAGNTAPFEEMLQRWQAVGSTVSDLSGPRFEPQTSRSRNERIIARPSGLFVNKSMVKTASFLSVFFLIYCF